MSTTAFWCVGVVCVTHLVSYLCCVFCFVCLQSVCLVPNAAYVSGLSKLEYLFDFLQRLFKS